MDFTHCGELGVTIGGEPFDHLVPVHSESLGLALCAGVLQCCDDTLWAIRDSI